MHLPWMMAKQPVSDQQEPNGLVAQLVVIHIDIRLGVLSFIGGLMVEVQFCQTNHSVSTAITHTHHKQSIANSFWRRVGFDNSITTNEPWRSDLNNVNVPNLSFSK